MALQSLSGAGPWLGLDPRCHALVAAAFNNLTINATGQKVAQSGRVWFPDRTGTKAIHRVGFRFGTVVKAGGSALTVSLQDPSTAAGPAIRPDETQDQTVAIANADAGFTSNVWYRTAALSADRTVSFGDLLSVVVEYDGAGRLGADSVGITTGSTTAPIPASAGAVVKSAGAWPANCLQANNIALEMSDGSWGCLSPTESLPFSSANVVSLSAGGSPNEVAWPFTVPFPCEVDGLRAILLGAANTVTITLTLYQGTTALASATIDGHQLTIANNLRLAEVPIAPTVLAAGGTQYYVGIKAGGSNNVQVGYIDVADAGQLSLYPAGQAATYTTRTGTGSWAAVTTTRALMAGVRLSALDDGLTPGRTLFVPLE